MINRLRSVYHEYPQKFWVVVLTHFIDGVGGTLLFPFFALYITEKFGVGMTRAGVLLGMFSFFGLVGSMLGGALTDKFGRRRLALFGLVFSALSTLALGFVNDLIVLYPLAVVIGLLSSIAWPAHQAMIADLLPENQRAEGFGLLRVVGNLAWIIGPTIGGFVAGRSFLSLFILDAILSSITAVIFYFQIPETKPETPQEKASESVFSTIRGYGKVTRDFSFMAFMLAGILMLVVYQQMYNTLSVYLRDVHGVSEQGYGFLLTSSAITVVLLQFTVSRLIKRRPPFLVMAIGTAFYMVGFSLFGFVSLYALFALAVVIITMGEMLVVPTSQALAANFAPEDMRGRYMAVFGLSWAIPQTIGPAAAGLIIDNFNPNLLWYIGGILCAISVMAYYSLHLRLGAQKRFRPAPLEEETAALSV